MEKETTIHHATPERAVDHTLLNWLGRSACSSLVIEEIAGGATKTFRSSQHMGRHSLIEEIAAQ
jgi:hypothetical protein